MSMADTIHARVAAALTPVHIELVNESHLHHGPPDGESHWNLLVVADGFQGKRSVARHRAVYSALGDELRGGIHALTLRTLTPDEWSKDSAMAPTPGCRGGSKS